MQSTTRSRVEVEPLGDRAQDAARWPGGRRRGRRRRAPAPAASTASRVTSVRRATASRKVSWPSMRIRPWRGATWIRSRARAVGAQQHRADPPGAVGRPDHHRAGAVAEQGGGAPVVGIDEARHQIGADHEHVARPARLDLARGERERRRGSRCTRRRRRALRRRSHRVPSATSGAAFGSRSSWLMVATTTRSSSAASSSGAPRARRARGRGGSPVKALARRPPRAARGCRCGSDPVLGHAEALGDRAVAHDGRGQRRAQRVQPRRCLWRRRAVQRSCADGEFGHAGNVPRRPARRPPDRGPFPPAGGKFPPPGGF